MKHKNIDYLKENESANEKIQALMNFMVEKYGNFLYRFLIQTPNVKETLLQHLTDTERPEILRGLIMCDLFNSLKVKSYIYEKLSELGLQSQTTLKEFYDFSSKKIQLNFLVVETPAKILSIINHKTRPKMPLWAAIVASCSIPFLFEPVLDRKEWKYKPNENESERVAFNYFSNQEPEASFLQSADLLLKTPSELLTDKKYQETITDKTDEVFLTFTFQNLIDFKLQRDRSSTPLSLDDLIWLFFNVVPKHREDLVTISGIPLISERLLALNQYVESHDNLIKKVYERELTILPTRVDTL